MYVDAAKMGLEYQRGLRSRRGGSRDFAMRSLAWLGAKWRTMYSNPMVLYRDNAFSQSQKEGSRSTVYG